MTSQAQTQVRGRFRDGGTDTIDTAPTWLAAENTNHSLDVTDGNAKFRLRYMLQENSAASGNETWTIRSQKNGAGGYLAVTTSTLGCRSADVSSSVDNAALTVQRLTAGTGSFIAGQYDETGATAAAVISASNHTEYEYGLELVAAEVVDGDFFDFRIYRTTTALSVYTVTLRITTIKTAASNIGMMTGSVMGPPYF